MKLTLTTALIISAAYLVQAQPPVNYTRRVSFHTIGKDSINLSLNSKFEMIEDSCAEIIRYGHFNVRERKFIGPFKDVSKQKEGFVLTQGTYTTNGLKTGLFTSFYLNGNLQSKGNYKENKFDGHWEIFYENGKPKLIFDANDNVIKIIDGWDVSGKKTVDNGKGVYNSTSDFITWKGKIDNGLPDGTWHAYRTDDATQTAIIDEHFKKGEFTGGKSPGGEYKDVSRIVLVNEAILPYNNTEFLHVSLIGCNGKGFRHIVNAQYSNGTESFSQAIKDAIQPFINATNIRDYEREIVINGTIDINGRIYDLQAADLFHDTISSGLIRQLRNLPALEPATADGKPVKQKFKITFIFHVGAYRFTYYFLPIGQNM